MSAFIIVYALIILIASPTDVCCLYSSAILLVDYEDFIFGDEVGLPVLALMVYFLTVWCVLSGLRLSVTAHIVGASFVLLGPEKLNTNNNYTVHKEQGHRRESRKFRYTALYTGIVQTQTSAGTDSIYSTGQSDTTAQCDGI